MSRPVFFDPTGKRRRRTRRALFFGMLLLVAAAIGFASTVVHIPAPSPLPLGMERRTPLRLRAQVSRLSHNVSRLFGTEARPSASRDASRPITIGFYTTWSDESAPSLARNINQIDWVVPTTLAIDGSGKLVSTDDRALRRIVASNLHRPLVLPMLQNVIGDDFSTAATTALLHDPRRRAALLKGLRETLARSGDAGIVFDFEAISSEDMGLYRQFVAEANRALDADGKIVAMTMPLGNPDWIPRSFAGAVDKLILMAYDEHWGGGQPGPIASNNWFVTQVSEAVRGLPPAKVVIALGSYAYDWHEGRADSLTVEEAWLAAHDSNSPPQYQRNLGNAGFSYLENGQRHDVWMLDAAASWNQMQALSRLGFPSIALWRLGSEDPGFWTALSAWRQGRLPDLSRIAERSNVDVEGQGEILRITAEPRPGERRISFDPASRLVTAETYDTLPTPYVVKRTGAKDKLVALTFDDGPDPKWTPKILSILEQYHVPGTFFVIGENGVENREILQRIARDGYEIGNHSYTHPNMANDSETGINLEINATQRLVEAYTGRSIRLFRAPYFGDAEPTTADELGPALVAQQHGYTVVGLHVDPGDWKMPGVPTIVEKTVQQVMASNPERSGNIVLLHDGGGDREQTVAALPAIITTLQRAGYTFVPVATLAGLTHDQVMPPLAGNDLLAIRADVFAFTAIAALLVAVNWTFFFAIALGIARSVMMVLLALWAGKPKPPVPAHADFHPRVTVIIPAYNEEKVIDASVRRILESTYPYLEVIVADDGSKDRTSEIVRASHGENPRVTLLTLENGGKATALNRALQEARGEIIVALDADTQFEQETITRLVRWFVDPRIGAVAGNAKVGNRFNLVTRWQAVEYVTAQNIERKALTRFDAIMVVPGAVGAWRRQALDDVGGYPEDTLAEDQDLTIAIQRRKWKVAYDEDAVAWTEAPESFRALAKQRFRWSYGTLQCLWKHRKIVRKGKPGGLAFIGVPQAWLFQIVFACISPFIDLALVISIVGTIVRVLQHGWAQTETDVLRMFGYWLCFTAIDLICGLIAFRMDVRETRFPAFLLLAQRFVYRQLMYGVVIRAVSRAIHGVGTGWGKLERTGRMNAPGMERQSKTIG